MLKIFSLLFLAMALCLTKANSQNLEIRLDWDTTGVPATLVEKQGTFFGFRGAVRDPFRPATPIYQTAFPLSFSGNFRVRIRDARFEELPDYRPLAEEAAISESIIPETRITSSREGRTGRISFVPIVLQNGQYQKLISASLEIVPAAETSSPANARNEDFRTESRLRQGQLYKIRVAEAGLKQLTYSFLSNELGISMDEVDPSAIRLLGSPSGPVSEDMDNSDWDDLREIPILMEDGGDGSFDPGDRILFYGGGPHRWRYDAEEGGFDRVTNIYDNFHYFFIQLGAGTGRRIEDRNPVPNTAITVTTFDDYLRFEEDLENILHLSFVTSGSGREWGGDNFRIAREQTYPDLFEFPNLVPGTARLKARMILRARVRSFFEVELEGATYRSSNASSSGAAENVNSIFASTASINQEVSLTDGKVTFGVRYPNQFGDSQGWLDYLQLEVTRQLRMTGNQMVFRSVAASQSPTATFRIENAVPQLEVWNITDPLNPVRQLGENNGSVFQFGVGVSGIPEFIAFDRSASFPDPEPVGPLPNQNLHSLQRADAVFIFPEEFRQEAERLADHRRTFSKLEVVTLSLEEILNEFSGGKKDPTAIRNLAKMMYERDPQFRFLLLFGDGSFDSRDVYGLGGDWIPTYQRNSLHNLFAYPSDDYFGLLSPTGSGDPFFGDLTIGVGRIPVKSSSEAAILVDKIIHYETAPPTRGDWRNRTTFVADDEDGNLHIDDADDIAEDVRSNFPQLNLDKIYLDAFPQVSTPGGQRFPAATEALNQNIFRGQMVVTYLGHGGSSGWAQERVLNTTDILSWTNYDNLPLFLTATCSFTGYDDPFEVTAGEEVILSRRGAGIGLMSTVRAVFANSNAALTDRALQVLFEKVDGRYRPLGEVFRLAKNTASASTQNSRKFALIGDPTMTLALPEYEVRTTVFNGVPLPEAEGDTIRALDLVELEGGIFDEQGQRISNFNGTVDITVFDKAVSFSTLGQDPGSPVFNYDLQKNTLFRGRASVQNGRFSISFVLPKDINFTFGPGKISYYARQESSELDATGAFEDFTLGGTSDREVNDNEGPLVEVFMNTKDFVFGGVTGPSPVLLVKLEDENGINVAGNTIGHDLEGVLNEDTRNAFILNDFYESELDDYTRGEVRFPLSDLEPGRYQIRVQAWDVANNSGEGLTEFVVATDDKIALEHVLNYPNPFTDRTCFQFDHNLAGEEIDVLVSIYTISGVLVKTIEQSFISDGAIRQDDCLEWDGRDDFGDRLARGVYLYRMKVRARNTGATPLEGESDFEKLVILK